MTALAAGARVLASEVNSALPGLSSATSSTTVTSSTTLVNGAGVSAAVVADGVYAWDAYLAYTAGATGDFKIAWTVPTGATGHWGALGLSSGTTGGVGTMTGLRITAYGDANTLTLGGSDSAGGVLACRPAGYLAISSTAGTFQLRVAQGTSSATSTVLAVGSWLRLVRLA